MSEKNKALINQIIRFGLVGISNTIVSYVIYAVAFALTDNYFLANVLSWLLSVLHAYIWQNVFVFKEDKNAQKRVWWKVLLKTYAAYAFTGLLLNNLLLWLWVDVIDILYGNCQWAYGNRHCADGQGAFGISGTGAEYVCHDTGEFCNE